MVHHIPSDQTFSSLIVGLFVGLSIAIGSYIILTQTVLHQVAALLTWLYSYGLHTWAALGIVFTLYVRIGWMTLTDEKKMKTEVRPGQAARGKGSDGRVTCDRMNAST